MANQRQFKDTSLAFPRVAGFAFDQWKAFLALRFLLSLQTFSSKITLLHDSLRCLDKYSAHNFGRRLNHHQTQVYVCTYSSVRQCLWWFRYLDYDKTGSLDFDEICERRIPNSPWENDVLPFAGSRIMDFTCGRQIWGNVM